MNARAKVLIVGHDPLLLETRKELLQTLVEAESIDNPAEAAAAIEAYSLALVIFCHTLTADECRELSGLARSKACPPKILGLCSPKCPERVGFVDCSLSLGYGPGKLIDTAAAMLEGALPPFDSKLSPRKMGGIGEHWRFHPTEIEAWLNTRTEGAADLAGNSSVRRAILGSWKKPASTITSDPRSVATFLEGAVSGAKYLAPWNHTLLGWEQFGDSGSLNGTAWFD